MEKRNTIQKQLVLDAVFRLANHPTAEEVYAEVARSHPSVSKATVYRNLGSLSEDGLLRHIKMPGGADRFDGVGEEAGEGKKDFVLATISYHSLCKSHGVAANATKAAFGLRTLHVDDDTHQSALRFLLMAFCKSA